MPVVLALAIITGMAFALRVYGLTGYDIWTDEAYHVALVKLPTVGEMLGAVLANPPSDPLYVLVLRAWAGQFGTGDASVRALSVIFGTLTVPATYALGTVVARPVAGLLGASLLAVSPYALEFSQEAALYALAALLATLSLWLGIRWQRSNRGALAYVLVAAVALYSHYVVAVILALFALGSALPYFRSANPLPARRFLLANGVAFALWLPWLLPLAMSWFSVDVARSSLPQDLTFGQVLAALGQYAAGSAALITHNRELLVAGALAGGVLMALAWWHSGAVERRHVRLILVIAGLVFFIPAIAAALTGRWLFVPHFMVFLLPAMCAVAGAAVTWSVAALRKAGLCTPVIWAAPAAFVALVAIQIIGVWQFFAHPPHGADGLSDMAAVLREEARPGEPVFVTPPALSMSLAQYFPGEISGLPEDLDLSRLYLRYDPIDWYRRSISRISELAEPGTTFWLVYRPERDEAGRLLEEVRSRFKRSHESTYGFATLYGFETP